MAINRRRPSHHRFPLRVSAVTEPVERLGGPSQAEAWDLSRGGVGLRVEQAIVAGASMRVTLRLNRRPPLTLVGTIAWVRPHPDLPGWAVGVRFDEELSGEMVVEIADEEHPPWSRYPRGSDG